MNVERRKVSELNEAPYNPRRMTASAKAGLKASLGRFGLVIPLVWNRRSGNLVGGHQRLAVLKEDGLGPGDEVDVVVVDLPDDQERALNLALNNPGSKGRFTADAIDLMSELEGSVGDAFAELGMEQLRFVLERIELGDGDGGPGGGGPPPRKTRPDGVMCPKCRAKWNRKTGRVISEGKRDDN